MSHDMQILAARGEASSANGNGATFGTTVRRGAQVVAARGAEAEAETFCSVVAKAKEEPQRREDGEDECEEPMGHLDEESPN
jgi:hypothetical protein